MPKTTELQTPATEAVVTAPTKTVKAKAPKTPKVAVAKVAKTPKVAEAGARPPAKELMAKRKRVTFGASFINGVLGGIHRDVAKMVLLGKALGVGTKSELSKLNVETLRERVGEAIIATPEGQLPTSVAFE